MKITGYHIFKITAIWVGLAILTSMIFTKDLEKVPRFFVCGLIAILVGMPRPKPEAEAFGLELPEWSLEEREAMKQAHLAEVQKPTAQKAEAPASKVTVLIPPEVPIGI